MMLYRQARCRSQCPLPLWERAAPNVPSNRTGEGSCLRHLPLSHSRLPADLCSPLPTKGRSRPSSTGYGRGHRNSHRARGTRLREVSCDQRRHHIRPVGNPRHPAPMDRHRRTGPAGPCAARRVGVGRARVRPAVLRAAARHRAAHRRDGDERQAPDRHHRDAAGVGAGLRHRLRLRHRLAVPAAAVGARDAGHRAVHHGVDGHSEIRADAVAHPLVRHRRPAEGDRRHAVRVLHRVHHGVRRRPRRRPAAGQHGARGRRKRTRHRPQGDLGVAAAVLLHRAEGGDAARGERGHRRRVPGGDRGHRLLHRARPAAVRHHGRVCRHRRRGGAGAADQRHRQRAGAPRAEMAADRPRYADFRSVEYETCELHRRRQGMLRRGIR